MEFGEMKRNMSNWSNLCMLLRRASLTASAGLSCSTTRKQIRFSNKVIFLQLVGNMTWLSHCVLRSVCVCCRSNAALEMASKVKKGKRCSLHSLDLHKSKALWWVAVVLISLLLTVICLYLYLSSLISDASHLETSFIQFYPQYVDYCNIDRKSLWLSIHTTSKSDDLDLL